MKALFAFLILITTLANAQKVEVERVQTLVLPEDARYFHPVFSPDGNRLLLTSENYQGLVLYDFGKAALTSISGAVGAGQYPVFSPDGRVVFFTEQEIVERGRRSRLMSYNIASGKTDQVEESAQPKQIRSSIFERWWQALFPSSGGGDRDLNIKALQAGKWDYPYAVVEKGKLMYYPDSNEVALDPLKARYYLHASLSPEGNRILAYAVGLGAFICDLKGENVKQAGALEAPVWLSENLVVGMITLDDGHVIKGAEIKAINVNSGNMQSLTPENIIAMHPSVANKKKVIAAHTQDGKIVLIHYNIL